MASETAVVFTELLAELGEQHRRLVEQLSGPGDEQSLVEAHKWILSILQVATDTQVWADSAHPRFIEIVGPYKKWGGDNADAFYCFAPVDPTGPTAFGSKRGDAVYLSLTVYGGPDDGRYSDRIVGSLNSREAPPDADGVIDMVLSPDDPGDGTPWIKLDPDAVAIVTRDYLNDPVHDAGPCGRSSPRARRPRTARTTPSWPGVPRRADVGARPGPHGSAPLGEPNTVDAPYPVPTATLGWAAGDAAYAMGSYQLEDDQALVLRGRSPRVRLLEPVPVEPVPTHLQLRL